jgi:hypothetical protein
MASTAKVARGLTRKDREGEAVRDATEAIKRLPAVHGCGARSLDNLVKAERIIAQARVHLNAIGFQSGPRTRKLWSVIGKADKKVESARESFKKCLVSHGLGGLKSKRRSR